MIDRDGVTIRYEAHGRGPALLLTHCFGSTMRLWDRQVARFADRHRIVIWDIRGHGGSGDPIDPALYSQALTIGDMAALLDACGIESAILGGLGLGGLMSLAFHRIHRERVAGLVLCDSGPGYRNHEAREAWNYRVKSHAHQLETKGFAALGRGRETMIAAHRSPIALANAARGMAVQNDALVHESLSTIRVPTLVIVGAADHDYFSAATFMTAMIPGARRVVIPDAGAISNLDQPAAFNRAFGAFLTDLRNAAAAPTRRPGRAQTPPGAGRVSYG
ncbi:MAG TPA: alpha/beta fold hydrolase [Stellaceae bacterium]|jgi:pimeloyl-ACP methyl ester carboxylesterase